MPPEVDRLPSPEKKTKQKQQKKQKQSFASTLANGVRHLQGGFGELSMLSHDHMWELALWHIGQKCMIIEQNARLHITC